MAVIEIGSTHTDEWYFGVLEAATAHKLAHHCLLFAFFYQKHLQSTGKLESSLETRLPIDTPIASDVRQICGEVFKILLLGDIIHPEFAPRSSGHHRHGSKPYV